MGSVPTVAKALLLLQSWPCPRLLALPTNISFRSETKWDNFYHNTLGGAAYYADVLPLQILFPTRQRLNVDS